MKNEHSQHSQPTRSTHRSSRKQAFHGWWLWCAFFMRLSTLPYLGRFFTWVAGLPLGPHRAKLPLRRIRPYISPRAEISCPASAHSRSKAA